MQRSAEQSVLLDVHRQGHRSDGVISLISTSTRDVLDVGDAL